MVPSTSEIYENGKQTVTYVAKAVDPYVPTAAKDAAGYVLVKQILFGRNGSRGNESGWMYGLVGNIF